MGTDQLLSDAFLTRHPSEAARVLERHTPAQIAEVVSECQTECAATIVGLLDPVAAGAALNHCAPQVVGAVIQAMPATTASGLLRRIDAADREVLLGHCPQRVAGELRALLDYSEDSAAALVDPVVLTAPPELTVDEVLTRVRQAAARAHYYLFVVDRRQQLVGVLSLRELLTAAADARVGAIARLQVATLPAAASWETVLSHPSWHDFHALPVVDADGRFFGVIRHETVRRIETAHVTTPLDQNAVSTAIEVAELACSAGLVILTQVVNVSLGARGDGQHRATVP